MEEVNNQLSRKRLSFMKFFLTFLVSLFCFFLLPDSVSAATLYWVGSNGANASVASNWSTTNPTSCSNNVTPSASAPVTADTLNFDADCDNGATIDSSFSSTVTSVVLSSGYTGTVTLSNPLTVSGAFTVSAGVWDSGSQSLTIGGTFTLNNAAGTFKASSGTTNLSSTMNATAGAFDANNGTLNFNGTTSVTLTCGATFTNLVLVTFTHTAGAKTVASSCSFPLGSNPTIPTSVASSGTFSGSGTLTLSAGTLTLTSGASLSGFSGFSGPRLTVNGATIDLSSFTTFLTTDSSSVIVSSGTLTLPSGADLNGTLTISGGTFNAPSGTITIGRNFTYTSGTFNHNNGTIELDGTVIQVISGSNTFYNLKKTVPTSNSLNFTAGTTQTILGTLTLQGYSNRPLTLQSTTAGSQWNIDPQGSRSVAYSYVKDSNNTNATAIDAGTGSSDLGNNTNWTFPPTQYVTATGITYTSTLDSLALKMDVSYDNTITDAPIILVLHGYSGTFSGQDILQRYAKKGMFAIKTYKRSFGGSAGTSDDSGREIYDFYDAIEYVKTNYSGYVDPTNINVVGYSGGGGNVYGLITKFPDYLRTAQVFFGMSDYGYDDTYGWWNNGADSTYQTLMTSRIGGSPTTARNNYYTRAHYLGAKNNPYTHIQLFYDTAETVVPVSHGTQYSSVASTAGYSNVVTRTSDSNTTVTELSEDFSSALNNWSFLGSGSTAHTRNSAGYLDWNDTSTTTFDVAYKSLTSLRSYSKDDHIKAAFDFKVTAAEDNANAFFSLRNSGNIALVNSISLQIQQASGVITPYIRIDYNGNNGTPLTSGNRSIQAFTTTLTVGTNYHMDLEVDNGVLTGILKDSDGNTLETKTLNFDATKTLDGVDSFGVSNFNNGGITGTEVISGTIDNITVTAWSRWIHGYPQEGAGAAEGNITAESYFTPDITAGTYNQPMLASSGTMFIPGYVKTSKFQLMLGNGNNHAGNLTYNISGNASTINTAKSFTVEGLTGSPTISLNVYNLTPSTSYYIKDTNITGGGSTTTELTSNSSGVLTFTGTLGSTHKYEIYDQETSASSIASSIGSVLGISTPRCEAQTPGTKAVWLYAAVPKGGNAIELYFTDGDDPYDHYAVQYGTSSGNYQYGAVNIGKKGIRTYLVQSLSPNTTYYFRIRSGNDCAPGPWSNEIVATTSSFISTNRLDFVSSTLKPNNEVEKENSEDNSCKTYTVSSGDTLWSIAENQLGDGFKFKDIAEQNKETYPSLSSSNSLRVGWKLKLECRDDKNKEKLEVGKNDYDVVVKVVDKNQKAVAGAKVVLHSTPKEAITDKDGVAKFSDVEKGQHKVFISYNNFEGEQSLNLEGDVKRFDLTVTVEPKKFYIGPLGISIIIVMALIIAVLSTVIYKLRTNRNNGV